MIWFKFDLDLLKEARFLRLERADPRHVTRLLRLVAVAKRADDEGRVTEDGNPLTPEDLAIQHGDEEDAWTEFLSVAQQLGFVKWNDGAWVIRDWSRRWSSPPPSTERVRRHRGKRSADSPEAGNADETLHRVSETFPCNAPRVSETFPCNTRNALEQSRVEQSRAEQIQSRAEQPPQTPHAALDPDPLDDPAGARDQGPPSLVGLLAGVLEGQCRRPVSYRDRSRLLAYCDLPGTPERKVATLKLACEDAMSRDDVSSPIGLAIKIAADLLSEQERPPTPSPYSTERPSYADRYLSQEAP